MKIMKVFLVFLVNLLVSMPFALSQSQSLKEKVHFLCYTALNQEPFDYSSHFSPDFIKALPEDHFHNLIADILSTIGNCIDTHKVDGNEQKATYQFISNSTRYVAFAFSIDENDLIDSLQIVDIAFPDIVIDSWDAAERYVHSSHGHLSITIENFSKKSLYAINGTYLQPLASGFKLYVLGALTDLIRTGFFTWDQTFPIRDEWKSLPTGVMQNLPADQHVSLKTFSEYMIRISDNTATDHLINIIGRSKVESQLQIMGNHFESLNKPFLTTSEMFKIKWASPLNIIDAFIRGDEWTRRSLLEKEVAAISLNRVGTNGVSMKNPSFIREIEWFGSTNDLCSAMKALKEKNSPEVFDILSKNIPSLSLGDNSFWSYGGYKGGSEPGVLTATYLVQNKNSEWGCIALAWHDENQNINQWVFFDFASKLLKLTESYF